jgi:ribonucleotide reductase alpha subunit
MDMSMFGVGVGSDTKGTGKVKIQTPKKTDKTYVVDDSREGWVDLLRTVLNSFVGKGHYPTNIDYSNVREMGSPIKGFGGVASGPEPLITLIDNVTKLLWPKNTWSKNSESYWIASDQIVDLHNMVGVCVVSGGVRRTAEIMFGHYKDDKFRNLKDPSSLNEWSSELYILQQIETPTQKEEARIAKLDSLIKHHPLRTHRWASNNSIFADVGMRYSDISDSIASNGEPGLLWLDNVKAYGRMVDPPNYKDKRVVGSNPCSEQSLEDEELCCLVETFPARHESFEDFQRTLKFAYLYAKTVTLIPTHNPKTNQVMGRNRRIGCSQSGIQQAKAKLGRREYLHWCDEGYSYIQSLDKLYSEWLCVPRSIKTTSVKPSGTVSLLCGATPGIHYPHSEYYIRNIRVQEGSPLIQSCIDAGYTVEEDAYASNSYVVSFPVKETDFARSKDDVTIWEQFADAADMQKYWADNQVSVTVTFSSEEKQHIATCLEMYEDKMKSVSLLPLLDHGYVQAPYVTITQKEYDAMVSNITELDLTNSKHEAEDKFCDGEACAIGFADEN